MPLDVWGGKRVTSEKSVSRVTRHLLSARHTFVYKPIRAAQQILFPDSLYIVPGVSKYVLGSTPEILV